MVRFLLYKGCNIWIDSNFYCNRKREINVREKWNLMRNSTVFNEKLLKHPIEMSSAPNREITMYAQLKNVYV